MVICLDQDANDLHMVQLMPLPPHHLLLQQNPEQFTFLMPAYPGCPGKRQLNRCSNSLLPSDRLHFIGKIHHSSYHISLQKKSHDYDKY